MQGGSALARRPSRAPLAQRMHALRASGCRSAFLGACFTYIAATHPATRFLTPAQASGALISLFVGQALAAELTGLPWDWSAVVMRAVLGVA